MNMFNRAARGVPGRSEWQTLALSCRIDLHAICQAAHPIMDARSTPRGDSVVAALRVGVGRIASAPDASHGGAIHTSPHDETRRSAPVGGLLVFGFQDRLEIAIDVAAECGGELADAQELPFERAVMIAIF